MKIIDTHTHLGGFGGAKEISPQDLLVSMDSKT